MRVLTNNVKLCILCNYSTEIKVSSINIYEVHVFRSRLSLHFIYFDYCRACVYFVGCLASARIRLARPVLVLIFLNSLRNSCTWTVSAVCWSELDNEIIIENSVGAREMIASYFPGPALNISNGNSTEKEYYEIPTIRICCYQQFYTYIKEFPPKCKIIITL